MSDTIIRVENLSKKYLLDHQQEGRSNYKSIKESLPNLISSFGKKILNPRREKAFNPSQEEFWALKDVSFEIKQGDRVGIIGRNGAGKSTLLKILSRITEPTSGRIGITGRIASLLEVGTGFHPELTGRENIFLNGAILGMSQVEIKRKFDEIVDFAEVEKFLDTPVKRYSSGMYVRLAFAVAAHLEPEILIVDEVLAVGDAQFQKKCLGKMKDVSKEGRTVLFVSHNMAATRALCSRALFMKNGQVLQDSNIEDAINSYLAEDISSDSRIVWDINKAPQSSKVRFVEAYLLNEKNESVSQIDCRKGFSISVKYEVLKPMTNLKIGFFMQNSEGVPICGSTDFDPEKSSMKEPGVYVSKCCFPGYILNVGTYAVQLGAEYTSNSADSILTSFCLGFSIEDPEGHGAGSNKLPGILRPKLNWDSQEVVSEKLHYLRSI
jgi:lipopolysaccharide transport system ATP-binding protein